MNIQLTPEEARVMGCLMEKAVTTPDQFPLTLNALCNACNQKSNRSPVMDLQKGVVQRTTRQLEDKFLVSISDGSRGIEKYSQRLCNTPLADCQFNAAEYAIICLLLLRGPQTPGEIRSRSGRLANFETNQHVVDALTALIEREGGAVVARLPRKAGRMDHEYTQIFSDTVESVPEESGIQHVPTAASRSEDRIEQLEARIEALENALRGIAEGLGEKIEL